MNILRFLIFLPLFVCSQSNLLTDFYFPENEQFNSKIPTPESIIGHQVGEFHISHDKLVQYMQALAESTDRIKIENRGLTFESRPLILLTITSKENHKKIDQIRQNHIKATNEDYDYDLKKRPVVVYQGFSIHGNEASGSNAAVLLAYYLAANESKYVQSLLKNTVILFDPALNPDGLQRFSQWVNSNKSKRLNPDPRDREYSENWPGGRTNHYWFDMNRDWLPSQLPESKVRLNTFHKWLPNILTDHHEMGTNSSFFFQPGVPSRTHPLTPIENQNITKEIGQYHAKAFDKLGSLYYSEEDYDDFYYGKGSTFPDVNGSIGILFEQASSRGHIQESDNGLLSFPFTIKNQIIAGLSTLEAAFNMREKLLKYQFDFFKNNREKGRLESNSVYIFKDDKDPAKSFHFTELLKRHNIQIHKLKNDTEIEGNFYNKSSTYVIPKNQKNNLLLEAIFEKRTKFKDSLFYDISAWTIPLAFGIDFTEKKKFKNIGELVYPQIPVGKLIGESNYAYIMPWSNYYSPKALYSLMEKSIRVKVALEPFSIEGRNYDYGSILIPVQNQKYSPSTLIEILNQISSKSNLSIYGISSGMAQGPDLGSNKFRTLKKPSVGLIVGDGIDSYDAGEIWHLMDIRYNIPITKLDNSKILNHNLDRYNCIILPNSFGLNETIAEKLKIWIKKGGNLIAYQNSLKWLNKNDIFKIKTKNNNLIANKIKFKDRSKFYGAQRIGGAIFEAKIDRSHPINFGYYKKKIALFRNTTIFIEPEENSFDNPIVYTQKPLLSGYISDENLNLLKETVPLKISSYGNGQIVGFTDNTNFRAFWYGTNKLLMNAIFFRNQY